MKEREDAQASRIRELEMHVHRLRVALEAVAEYPSPLLYSVSALRAHAYGALAATDPQPRPATVSQ